MKQVRNDSPFIGSFESERALIASVCNKKVLPHEEALALVGLAQQGDGRAMEKLVLHNGRFILKIARRLGSKYGGLSNIWDTFSVCRMGFMKGVMQFDASKGWRITTYTAWTMRKALQESKSYQPLTISIPDYAVVDFIALRYADCSSWTRMTDEELSVMTGVSLLMVKALRPHLASPLSFDAPTRQRSNDRSGSMTLLDRVADSMVCTETSAQQNEILDVLESAIKGRLNDRERTILKLRYWDEYDLVQAGKTLGISGERVRQLQRRALIKLRGAMRHITP